MGGRHVGNQDLTGWEEEDPEGTCAPGGTPIERKTAGKSGYTQRFPCNAPRTSRGRKGQCLECVGIAPTRCRVDGHHDAQHTHEKQYYYHHQKTYSTTHNGPPGNRIIDVGYDPPRFVQACSPAV